MAETGQSTSASRQRRCAELRIPIEDPLASLPPTARDILEAARRLLLAKGVAGFTVDAVTKEAGVNKAAVSYYFGGKAGLIATVVDATVHDACVSLREEARELPPGRERLTVFLGGLQRIAENEEAYRLLFNVLPYALTNKALRKRLGDAYDWYRRLNLVCVGSDEPIEDQELKALAALIVAALDGLAIQRVLSGGELDLNEAFALLGRMVQGATS